MDNNVSFKEMERLVFDLNVNEDEFAFFIMQNEDTLLKEDPVLFIGLRTDFYLQRDEIEKGLEIVNFYKNSKYISMEVEDFLNELKTQILRDSKNKKNKSLSDEEIENYLFSNNEYKIVDAIRELSNKNIRKYLQMINRFLNEVKNEKMHRLILILMVEQKVDNNFVFYLNGCEKTITPNKLTLPFDSDNYKFLSAYIHSLNKDPSVIARKKEIYSYIMVQSFPYDPFSKMDIGKIYSYIELLDKELLGMKIEKNNDYDEAKLLELKEYLSK